MELKTTNLLDIIQNTQVFYSAKYFGEYKAPFDLLDLLLENIGTREPLTLGIMYFQKKEKGKFIVIDGIKRLISFSLLLYALCECFKLTSAQNNRSIELIKQRFLYNNDMLKIQLFGQEKFIYERLVNHEKLSDEEKQHPMFETLHTFWAKIKMNNISPSQLFSQIKKINIIPYVYESSEIDSKDLYKLINYNNPYTEELQLITHFIHEHSNIGLNYWLEIVDLFKNADMKRKIKYFLIDFLTLQKNGIIPKENEIYISFKKYYLKNTPTEESVENLFKHLLMTAKHYIKISTANFNDEKIRERIKTIKENNMYETFPYLLEVTEDYSNGAISKETFCKLLDTVILFIAEQRCNNDTNIINFGTLSREINLKIINSHI